MNLHLTESLEDYLEAIAELIAVNGHAHSKEIAEKLNVKMPSVTGALRQLERMGCIVYNTHYPVQLTPQGKVIADRVMKRHRILKQFFSEILGLSMEKASETACRLEHAVDEETIERFILFSEAIGNRYDARSLQTYLTEAMAYLGKEKFRTVCVLSELHPGEKAVVELFSRNLAENIPEDIAVGDSVVLDSVSLDKTLFLATVSGQPLKIPLTLAENIWVRRPAP